jgi:hypothetical protein
MPRIAVIFILLALFDVAVTAASSLSVPITPLSTSGSHGDYLSAAFDFGTKFSDIESVNLEFLMPDGYQGWMMFSGSGVHRKSLEIVLHEDGSPIEEVYYDDIYYATALNISVEHVAAGIVLQTGFGVWIEPYNYPWPNFLLDGHGRISFFSNDQSFYSPLLDLDDSYRTTWTTPGAIHSAQLTIVGTTVAEPAAAVFVIVAMTFVLVGRRVQRQG